MPNVYLRMPLDRCLFFRHRDSSHILGADDPVAFSAFSPEYYTLRSYITNAQAVVQQVSLQCFSHQQWQNMKNGKSPLGGKSLFKRDPLKHLSYDEVCRLNGCKEYVRSDKVDYLCIKLPCEVMVDDMVRHVAPSWNLNVDGTRILLTMLNNDFKRSIVEWALATFDFCIGNGRIVCRSQSAMLERWLMRYGIEPTVKEKDNIRRVIDRWLKTTHSTFGAYSCFDMRYIDDNEHAVSVRGIESKIKDV